MNEETPDLSSNFFFKCFTYENFRFANNPRPVVSLYCASMLAASKQANRRPESKLKYLRIK